MNQFFHNLATTSWATRLVLFVMTAKFSQCAVKENKGHQHPNPSQAHEQIIERNRFTWFLKLSMKYSLLFSNINVSKQSQQNTKKVEIFKL